MTALEDTMMARAGRWFSTGLVAGVLLWGCASGTAGPSAGDGGTGPRDGAPMDAPAGDATLPDAATMRDARLPDAGRGGAVTCEACAENDDCVAGSYCAELMVGGRACLPVCNIDIPDCPPRFECVVGFSTGIPEPVCAPVGERCCVDFDGDLHGQGVGCLGLDCDDTDETIHESATETCDGVDEDCDGTVDDGDPSVLCVRGEHVASTRCGDSGACEIAACEPTWADCDLDPGNGCEQWLDDPAHCGACGAACDLPNAIPGCSAGSCIVVGCDAGFGDCNGLAPDGCEVSLTTTTHCGGCGTTCARDNAITTCDTGLCAVRTCDPNWGNCDGNDVNGCETPLVTNANCGTCGTICAPTGGSGDCSTGTCRVSTCASGFADCDGNPANGCETSTRTLTDCGGCGIPCGYANATTSCAAGACTLTSCDPGYGNCDGATGNGCETRLATTTSCGGCGTACAPANAAGDCASGTCAIATCNAGYADCDARPENGCETSLRTTLDCGGCGVLCERAHASPTCATGACRIGGCEPGYANCDGIDANGCETSIRTTSDCGGCGVICARTNATATCGTGSCAIATCNPGFANCDGVDSNGCETPLNTTTSCGGCGTACARANATADCSTGTCRIGACSAGFANCDGIDANGCEAPLNTTTDCGSCGTGCSRTNASATCATGACRIGTCNAGFASCDGSDSNGCETPTTTLTDCGACGVTCSRPNAIATCSSGACRIAACNPGFGNCDGLDENGCETPLTTVGNCGGCGVSCSRANAAASCSSGSCRISSCSAGYGDCDGADGNGCETRLNTLSDCGACGTACARDNATATCSSGSCAISSCTSGWASCDSMDANGCETSTRTVSSCGGCGIACAPANASGDCSTGTCAIGTCNPNYGNCDSLVTNGCETSLTTNANCGTCGTACSPSGGTGDCSTGTCRVSTCAPGYDDCDGNSANGCETHIRTLTDCGSCGTTCSRAHATATCASGACSISTCDSGYGNCDGTDSNGCEAPLTTLSNCGGCGVGCSRPNATASCATGSCTLGACNTGWANCDGIATNGCETSLRTTSSCGACGVPCTRANATADCSTGACRIGTCNAGWANCDGNDANGCETSITSLTSCGACGVACARANATATCSGGSCQVLSCNAGWANCDGNDANGCETPLNTLTNCGGCGVTCSRTNATATCGGGSCAIASCNAGYGNCDGTDSNGCEQPLNTLTHCGGCSVGCSRANASATCATGSCQLGTCNAGYGNCDGLSGNGCEQTLTTLSHCGACSTSCSLANATESCGTGSCQISACASGWGNCDGSTANGCEQTLTTLTHCGGCGVGCSRPNASATCSTGSCAISSCNAGYDNCDGNSTNGCELHHATATNSCGTATYVGAYDGDRYCGIFCGSNTGWDLFATRGGNRSAWFRARAVEDSTCSATIEHQIRLVSPAGTDYDLYVYRPCGTLVGYSVLGSGTDIVTVSRSDSGGSDDSFDYWVEVRYYSGSHCTNWTLSFYGHNC